MGGHLKKVETCSSGVTWGIGYDSTAWVYTGGWGSLSLKGKVYFKIYQVYKFHQTSITYLYYVL